MASFHMLRCGPFVALENDRSCSGRVAENAIFAFHHSPEGFLCLVVRLGRLCLIFSGDDVGARRLPETQTLDYQKWGHRMAWKSLPLCAELLEESRPVREFQFQHWKEVHQKSLFYHPLQTLRFDL